MDQLPILSIPSDDLARLIVKTRGVQAGEQVAGGDIVELVPPAGEQRLENVREDLQALDDRQQHELVALVWTGRGDAEPDEFEESVELASEFKKDGPMSQYLLKQPGLAESLAKGARRLGVDLPNGEEAHMDEVALSIINGPDKPAMLWSLAYPEREQSVQFKTAADTVEVGITRLDELGDGTSFALRGRVASGEHKDRLFTGSYSVQDRAGELLLTP